MSQQTPQMTILNQTIYSDSVGLVSYQFTASTTDITIHDLTFP